MLNETTKDSMLYKTNRGKLYCDDCENFLKQYLKNTENKKADLIFTSPPFPLNRAKRYGNMTGEEYLLWFSELAPVFCEMLNENGSIVIEIGNAWEKGMPVHSTLPLETLLAFKNKGELYLCQEFIHYNPSTLPAPIEWVNKKRIRVKDSFTRLWWLAKTPYPKADNRNVLTEYSRQMKKLINNRTYNAGKRPSEHVIGVDSFCVDNGGAIPSNVITAANTVGKGKYFEYCKQNNLEIHPARMPREIPEFFIKMLTDEGDLVFDPFAGSNMTGAVAEELKRNWISIEINEIYAKGSRGRFLEVY
jgi:site-specific DNA-methyltransferase (cytosine-N4-specific)